MKCKLELYNSEKLPFIIDSLHRINEFCKINYIPIKYNDTMIINVIVEIDNKLKIPLAYAIKGIDSILQCRTNIIELNEYGDKIKTL